MRSKKESPINLTLEKAPSGTWKIPRTQRLPFKPWQRLWLATGIIYLLMLAGTYHLLAPNQESVERRMVLAVIEEVHRYDGMAFAGETPRAIIESARKRGYPAWIGQLRSTYRIGSEGDPGFNRIETNYKEQLSDLPTRRAVGLLICIVAWIVPMGLLYAMGGMVEWIRRGARKIGG